MTHGILALASAMAFAGFLFGLGYFATLRRTVGLLVTRHSLVGPVALSLGRIAAAVIFLMLAAKLGALPLLATLVGFLLARSCALRAVRRAG